MPSRWLPQATCSTPAGSPVVFRPGRPRQWPGRWPRCCPGAEPGGRRCRSWRGGVLRCGSQPNWGASGSGAELIVAVPAILTGAASLPVLWDTLSKRILSHGKARFMMSAEGRAELARTWLAESLNIGVDSVEIVNLEPVSDGSRVELKTPDGVFDVELDSRGVCRMRRQQSP